MIVNESGDRLLLIEQLEHANLAAQFAAHWGNGTFAMPAPYPELLAAAALHDDGFRIPETIPIIDPNTKRPYNFYERPREGKIYEHKQTIQSVSGCKTYTRLMVSMHRTGLLQERYGLAHGWKIRRRKTSLNRQEEEFVLKEERWQSRAALSLRRDKEYRAFASHRIIWMNYKLIQVWDRMSLYLCGVPIQDGEIYPTPTAPNSEDVHLSLNRAEETASVRVGPWPFEAQSIHVHLKMTEIPNVEFGNETELCKAIYHGNKTILRFELSPM